MKNLIKLSMLLLAFVIPTITNAYVIEVDGIYYGIYGSSAVVTNGGSNLDSCSYSGNIVIPESVTYNDTTYSVTDIGIGAFYYCTGLTSVTIPNSVISIGEYAFEGCSGLTSITIPNSVTSISEKAFYYCTGLTSITIPNSVTRIGEKAFYYCNSLDTLNFNAVSCAYSWGTPFDNRISFINIGDSVLKIPAYFVNGLTKLTNITFGKSVTSIGDYAFNGCSALAGNLTLPKSITYIGNYAFSGCSSLVGLSLPKSVTSIGDYAFNGCSSFAGNLCLPKSVTSIGKQAFNNIATIEAVTCAAETPPAWNDLAMFTANVYNHSPLYVPIGSERTYMSDQCWGQFSTIIGKNMNDEVQATGISLNQSQMNLMIGGSAQLIATVMPDSTTNKVVTWASNDPTVATVNANGLVSALGVGTATITATTTDGSNLSASCMVTVTEDLSDFDNFLSIDDMEAFHGDTIVIPVKMINEASIISFQTDIFLPEGLELLQEDGEYIIDPSERMTRTHSIMSNAVSNGAVRVICYSSNYKPFTGNSGDDLFYITVKVADDAEGDYSIQLKNTLFTTSTFEELTAPDIAANIHVKAYIPGDANNSGTVTVTDVVVTSQYVLEMNPQPFNFDAADVNDDGTITVTDVTRIAWMVLNPSQHAPLRAPALWNNGDLMSGNDITITAGETRRVSIVLNNEMDYTAFQCDLNLPEGLTVNNFQLTDRASRHAFDVNTLSCGKIRALCYSPAMDGIHGHEGALLTFDVTANGDVNGHITIDGIELVTTACQTVRLDAFSIGVNNSSNVNELATGKTISKIEYFNLAGQQIDSVGSGVTLVVTTYTDGSRSTSKVIR